MQLDCLDQHEGPLSQEDHTRVKIRHRVRQMLSDVPAEENKVLMFKGKSKIYETWLDIFDMSFMFYNLYEKAVRKSLVPWSEGKFSLM